LRLAMHELHHTDDNNTINAYGSQSETIRLMDVRVKTKYEGPREKAGILEFQCCAEEETPPLELESLA
jgi:hypothetical protein